MKLKYMGKKHVYEGYMKNGYYIRIVQTGLKLEFERLQEIKAWCALNNGELIDHNTIVFDNSESAIDFMESLK